MKDLKDAETMLAMELEISRLRSQLHNKNQQLKAARTRFRRVEMCNDFHEGDMAGELAEVAIANMSVEDLLDIARKHIHDNWQKHAMEKPDSVRTIYESYTKSKGKEE